MNSHLGWFAARLPASTDKVAGNDDGAGEAQIRNMRGICYKQRPDNCFHLLIDGFYWTAIYVIKQPARNDRPQADWNSHGEYRN